MTKRGGEHNTMTYLMSGIFLLSLSVLTFEITLTRLLSIVISYHYVFAVVSLTLLGLGSGGVAIQRLASNTFYRSLGPKVLSWWSMVVAVTMILSVVLVVKIGTIDGVREKLVIYAVPLFFPFFSAGCLLSDAFHRYSRRISSLYGADLLGAGLGCCVIVIVLSVMSSITAAFLAAVFASSSAVLFAAHVHYFESHE